MSAVPLTTGRGEAPSLAYRLAEELMRLEAASEARAAVAKARLCLVDFLSCAFAGSRLPWPRQALALAGHWPAAAGAGVIGCELRFAPGEAAYLNALMAVASQRTDMHPASTVHAGAVVFPVVLALASVRPASGADLVAAVVAGYEAAGRLGRIVVDEGFRRHRRATSVLGVVGGAVAAARLLRLDPERATHALALAADTAAGLMEWGHSGEAELFYQPANAARNAVTAALLAQSGARASPRILEGEAGFLAAFGGRGRAEALLRRDGRPREIETVEIKPVPACVFAQAAAHAAQAVVERHRPAPESIARIELTTFADAIACPGCDNPGPIGTVQAARMSLQHSVAAALARGGLDDDNYLELEHPLVRRLTPRVAVGAAAAFTEAFPAAQGATVEVVMDDGRRLAATLREVPRISDAAVIARFRRAGLAVAAERQLSALLEAVDRLPDLPEAGAVLAALFAGAGGEAHAHPGDDTAAE